MRGRPSRGGVIRAIGRTIRRGATGARNPDDGVSLEGIIVPWRPFWGSRSIRLTLKPDQWDFQPNHGNSFVRNGTEWRTPRSNEMTHQPMGMRVRVVDPSGTLAPHIRNRCTGLAETIDCRDFDAARLIVLAERPAFLLTDLRLGVYNGLHLAYVAATSGIATRTIVFAHPLDPTLATEAQRMGAFVESRHRLPFAIASYLSSRLPPFDRRNPERCDRRRGFRGGRRASDAFAERRIKITFPHSCGDSTRIEPVARLRP